MLNLLSYSCVRQSLKHTLLAVVCAVYSQTCHAQANSFQRSDPDPISPFYNSVDGYEPPSGAYPDNHRGDLDALFQSDNTIDFQHPGLHQRHAPIRSRQAAIVNMTLQELRSQFRRVNIDADSVEAIELLVTFGLRRAGEPMRQLVTTKDDTGATTLTVPSALSSPQKTEYRKQVLKQTKQLLQELDEHLTGVPPEVVEQIRDLVVGSMLLVTEPVERCEPQKPNVV